MATKPRASAMTNFEILTRAAIRMDVAERAVELAEFRLDHLAPTAPLRYSVAATRRLRDANAELEAARVAYEAAQDLPAPDD